MKSCIGIPSVDKLDKWGYYLLCGFALLSNLTIAGGNIFLGPLVLVFFFAHNQQARRLAPGVAR